MPQHTHTHTPYTLCKHHTHACAQIHCTHTHTHTHDTEEFLNPPNLLQLYPLAYLAASALLFVNIVLSFQECYINGLSVDPQEVANSSDNKPSLVWALTAFTRFFQLAFYMIGVHIKTRKWHWRHPQVLCVFPESDMYFCVN